MALAKNCCSALTSMWSENPHPSTELISGDGKFNEAGFKNFLKSVELHEHGAVVVAIIGQQSSGKSTLMNHLFGTNFEEMNALLGRRATTKGIWIAKAPQMESLTIAVDLEGTDGQERGEDDKAFERQSAVFAALIADVLIINMCCKNVGLDQGGNRPLLKVIFEAMMRLFGPHKTTLLFVLRDKTKTPVDKLERALREGVEEIWKTALKPPGHEETLLSEIFNVEVAALSNYESTPDIFEDEVAKLKSRLFKSISLDGSKAISFSSAKIAWDTIKGCKDLDLPSLKVMVGTVRCEEIAMEKLRLFKSDKEWLVLEEAAERSLISSFFTKISSILDKYLSQYDSECIRYENDVRRAKREYLMSEASKVVRTACMNTLDHLRSNALRGFDTQLEAALSEGRGFSESVRTCQDSCEVQFDELCASHGATLFSNSDDVSNVRRQLLCDIEQHWHLVRADKLPQVTEQQRDRLSTKFRKELIHFLNDNGDKDTWGCIRSMVRRESDAAALALAFALAEFELDRVTLEEKVDDLKQSAKKLVVKIFKEETTDVAKLLQYRFINALIPMGGEFNQPTKEEASDQEVNQPTKEDAYIKCVKLLSTLAVIRLDEREGDDHVESLLLSALMPTADQISPDPHPLASHTWEQVPPTMTLITPVSCRDIWNQFRAEMEQHFADAKCVQEQCVEANHRRPLTWVITGLLILGGSVAFMAFIRVTNIDVVFALGRAAKAIATVVEGIGIAAAVVGEINAGIECWEQILEAIDFTEFCNTYHDTLKSMKKVLKKLYKRMTSIVENRKATMAKHRRLQHGVPPIFFY